MYIILMRHGEAEEETPDKPNQDRALTRAGRKEVRKSAKMLAHFLKETPIRIFASPYKRTRETAYILSEQCFCSGMMTASELLTDQWQLVENHLIVPGSPIALVSHHPYLSGYLLSMGCSTVPFDTGGIAVVDYDLRWKKGKLIGYFSPALQGLRKVKP